MGPSDFYVKDQGGQYVQAQTRTLIAGLHEGSGANDPIGGMGCQSLQGVGAGQMLYAIPHAFNIAGTIKRLVTRTDGTTGVGAGSRLKMAIYAAGSLASGTYAGSPYPGVKLIEGDDHNLYANSQATQMFETLIEQAVEASSRLWFALGVNADAVTNQNVIVGVRRNYLYPILGYTYNPQFNTVSQDALTLGVGWRHGITYVTSDEFPDPFPQSSPAPLTGGANINTINVPAIGFGWAPA